MPEGLQMATMNRVSFSESYGIRILEDVDLGVLLHAEDVCHASVLAFTDSSAAVALHCRLPVVRSVIGARGERSETLIPLADARRLARASGATTTRAFQDWMATVIEPQYLSDLE